MEMVVPLTKKDLLSRTSLFSKALQLKIVRFHKVTCLSKLAAKVIYRIRIYNCIYFKKLVQPNTR